MWSELRGETPPQPFDRGAQEPNPPWWGTGVGATVMDMITPEPCRTIRRAAARAVRNLGPRSLDDRLREVLSGHVDQQDRLDVVHANGVEQDVDPRRRAAHVVHVLLYRVLNQRIDLCRLGDASRGGDLLGARLDPSP